jgi:hypothetical protein
LLRLALQQCGNNKEEFVDGKEVSFADEGLEVMSEVLKVEKFRAVNIQRSQITANDLVYFY